MFDTSQKQVAVAFEGIDQMFLAGAVPETVHEVVTMARQGDSWFSATDCCAVRQAGHTAVALATAKTRRYGVGVMREP